MDAAGSESAPDALVVVMPLLVMAAFALLVSIFAATAARSATPVVLYALLFGPIVSFEVMMALDIHARDAGMPPPFSYTTVFIPLLAYIGTLVLVSRLWCARSRHVVRPLFHAPCLLAHPSQRCS